MLTSEQQETLTRVGPGTPMGRLLRRYWFPVAGSSELAPGRVLPVRLLAEDLALFRTTEGSIGVLEARCPHRGASLANGIVDDASVRCPYHGWRFARSGECVERPCLASDQGRGANARAYRAGEIGGLVFVYLGPEPVPLLPRYDLFVWPRALRDIGRATIPCNWLQIMENSVDPLHVEWLHGHHLAEIRRGRGLTAPLRYPRRHREIGFDVFAYGIVKRRLVEGASKEDDDWRVGHPLVFPSMVRVGAGRQHRLQIRVPIDDGHTLHFWYSCYRAEQGAPAPEQHEVPVYDVPYRDQNGNLMTDTVDGGDIMAWLSQGQIADRTREHLVASDTGVVLLRRLLFEQMERVRCGEDPMGVVRSTAENEFIELPQERDKYGEGDAFLAETLSMSHVRFSPIRTQIFEFLGFEEPPELA